MSNYLAILADIKTKMLSVTGIGQVHDYERWNNDSGKFLNLFAWTPSGGSQQIRGWEITRVKVPEHHKGPFYRHHRFRISGYMALNDAAATDKTFQVLVDDACEKFRNAAAPAGSCWFYLDGDKPDQSPVQVEVIDLRMFGGVLCHHADIMLAVMERIVA